MREENQPQSPLQARILEQLRLQLSDNFSSGERVNEAKIAEHLQVSRSPVRRVLQRLQAKGVVDYEANRGFVVSNIEALLRDSEGTEDALLDDRVMRDMAIGELTTVISERALLQRYEVAHGVLMSTLRRLMRDGLVTPSPGRGWVFTDVTPSAIADSYRFRKILEPAALLAEGYKVDERALQTLDDDHVIALQQMHKFDRRRLFNLDARFHKVLTQGTQSLEAVASIERQNNIRRVTEYIGHSRLDRIRESMIEHREILAALLNGDRRLSASYMHIHLQRSQEETFKYMDDDLVLLRNQHGLDKLPMT